MNTQNFTIEGKVLVTSAATCNVVSGANIADLNPLDTSKTYRIVSGSEPETGGYIRITRYERLSGKQEEIYTSFQKAAVRYMDLLADGYMLVEQPTLADKLLVLVQLLYVFAEFPPTAVAWFLSKAQSVDALDLMNDPTLEDRFGCPEADAEVLSAIRRLSGFRRFLTDMQADISACHREVQVVHKMIGLVDQAIAELAYDETYLVQNNPPAAKAEV